LYFSVYQPNRLTAGPSRLTIAGECVHRVLWGSCSYVDG